LVRLAERRSPRAATDGRVRRRPAATPAERGGAPAAAVAARLLRLLRLLLLLVRLAALHCLVIISSRVWSGSARACGDD
jgi:hypothetical protein